MYGHCFELFSLAKPTDWVNMCRWDMAAMEQLPEYMKGCFRALYGITNEFAFKVNTKHGWNPITTLVKSVKSR